MIIKWHHKNGNLLACDEKIKVMDENINELKQMLKDIYEDGILMEIDQNQLKQELIKLIQQLKNHYKE